MSDKNEKRSEQTFEKMYLRESYQRKFLALFKKPLIKDWAFWLWLLISFSIVISTQHSSILEFIISLGAFSFFTWTTSLLWLVPRYLIGKTRFPAENYRQHIEMKIKPAIQTNIENQKRHLEMVKEHSNLVGDNTRSQIPLVGYVEFLLEDFLFTNELIEGLDTAKFRGYITEAEIDELIGNLVRLTFENHNLCKNEIEWVVNHSIIDSSLQYKLNNAKSNLEKNTMFSKSKFFQSRFK